jgi:hypothetical protein
MDAFLNQNNKIKYKLKEYEEFKRMLYSQKKKLNLDLKHYMMIIMKE